MKLVRIIVVEKSLKVNDYSAQPVLISVFSAPMFRVTALNSDAKVKDKMITKQQKLQTLLIIML